MSEPYQPSQAVTDYASSFRFDDGLTEVDRSHLDVLGILHFVWGGLAMLGTVCGLLYLGIGVLALVGASQTTNPNDPSPAAVGGIFIVVGAVLSLLTLTIGLLNILAGRNLRARRGRGLILAASVINCISIPLGLILAIFTFIKIGKPEVKASFERGAAEGR